MWFDVDLYKMLLWQINTKFKSSSCLTVYFCKGPTHWYTFDGRILSSRSLVLPLYYVHSQQQTLDQVVISVQV